MAAKLAFLILAIALTGASLLSVRQQRLQVVHEMTQMLEHAERTQRAVWRVRSDLAARITPQTILAAIERESEDGVRAVTYQFCPPGTLVYDEPDAASIRASHARGAGE